MKTPSFATVGRWLFFGMMAIMALGLGHDIYIMRGIYDKALAAPEGHFAAAPESDLTVVEFLSYNCDYCKTINPIITAAIQKDGRIKYMPKPVLMEDEQANMAARAVYAAGLQGRFMDMHHELLKNTGVIDESLLRSIALKLGLDGQELIDNLENPAIKEALVNNTIALAGLKGFGTPSFLIGNRLFFHDMARFPTANDFLNMFEESRNL